MAEPGRTELPVNIEDEMRESYLDYAMSVIIGRALPDIRDGLKPVHRRILYSMQELSNTFNRAHKKSARIVGEVIGKYHPHGDAAVYDTMVRMAQGFSMREILVDGQGNFGSVDGDSPAAMRYTEVRMSRIATELLADIERDTVDFVPNYDESLSEPTVLPARFPNLLVNGTSGIAVGMATNIPPHNLSEVVDAALLLLDREDASLAEVLELIPGPDFPTGAFIYGRQGIFSAYQTGRGIIYLRARSTFEPLGKDRESIIIHELPYQVNKARLIEKIAQLVNQKKIQGISDLRDESDRRGMRVVIELKRGEPPQIVLNTLYKLTSLQSSFGIILLAIVNGRPRVLSITEVIGHFLEHRKDVVRRRTAFELDKAVRRAHVLDGLRIALGHLDQIIDLIRKAQNPAAAKEALVQQFELTEIQAQAILEMRLQRLTGLEREKIEQEYSGLQETISRLRQILEDKAALKDVIREELVEIQATYKSPRRTEIVDTQIDLSMEDLIAEEQMVITASRNGYIKRTSLSTYRSQHRGGKGRIGMSTRTEEDIIADLFVASTHSYMLIFTARGKLHWLKAWKIPEIGTTGKGKPIVNLINIDSDDRVADMLNVRDFEGPAQVVTASLRGYVKKTPLSAYSNPRSSGIIACGVDEGDELMSVMLAEDDRDMVLFSRQGKAIRFNSEQVRSMGRTARGVRGIRLRPGDELIGMEIVDPERADLLAVTEHGFGKRTPIDQYRAQGRGGQGVINIRTSERNGDVVTSFLANDDSDIMIITENGKLIRLPVHQIRLTVSRSAQGVKLIDLGKDDRVADVSLISAGEDEEEETSSEES